MVNLFRYKFNSRSFLLFLCSLVISFKSFGVEIDTGNILTNSTFGTGTTYDTTGWTIDEHTHGHNYMSSGGGNDPGGSVAAEEETVIEQTIKLSEKTNMTTQEIQNGWSSTIGADIWYWNNYSNTTTLKQTITGSDGSVSTQQRVINNTGCGSINCGQFNNYTDTHIQGSNTQSDFDIKVSVKNTNSLTGHWGPDIDNVTLNVNYTYIPPINEETQDVIDDIDTDIITIIENLPEDFDWYEDELPIFEIPIEEEIVFEDDFTFDDSFYFEDIEIVDIEELPPIEEFEMEGFEEMPDMEMVFFEEEFSEPIMVSEEMFTEEFEEDFTEFLEETGMEEEFIEFLEEEGITAEEFFEEITEEEFNDELTEESFEEFEEPLEDIATEEESVPEVVEEEKETVEEVTESESVEEEKEVATNETEEEKPDSTETEDSDVSTEESGEQEDIQSEEVEVDDKVKTDVANVETKLKKNLKTIAKQIAKVTKETTKNLSKEDLFFKGNDLDSYKKVAFYSAKEIYNNTNMGLFLQIDLSSYSGEIYVGTSLSSYTDNDPVEVHRVKLLKIETKKRKLQAELEALKQ
jgi:hypothetical protein